MARRKRKKGEPPIDELVAPDAFETAGASGVGWFESNFRYILLGAAVILGSVLLYEVMSSSATRDNATMTAELNTIVESFNEATDMRAVLTSTSAEQVNETYRDIEKKLADFRAKYADRDAAHLAGLYEAELLRRLDKPGQAIPLYERYLKVIGEGGSLAFMAHEGAGYAYEAQKQLDQALSHYEKLATYGFAKAYALKHQARVQEAKNDRERAQALYRQLAELDADGPLKTFAEERLRVLE